MSSKTADRALLAIVGLMLIVGGALAAIVPLWQAHEADFYTAARILAREGRLPTAADYPAGDADIRQATQPPLFFIAAAPLIGLLDDGQTVPPAEIPFLLCPGGEEANPAYLWYAPTTAYDWPPRGAVAAGYAVRLLDLLFGAAAVVFTYAAARTLFPDRPLLGVIAAGVLAFEPNTLAWSAQINNDTLLLTIAAANLYGGARLLFTQRAASDAYKLDARWLVWIGVTAAAALLTRLTGWAIPALSVLMVVGAVARAVMSSVQRGGAARRALIGGGIGIALIVLGIIGVAAFNVAQYGNALGRYADLDRVVLNTLREFRLPIVTVRAIIEQSASSFLQPLQTIGARRAIVVAYGVVMVAAVIGAVGWAAAAVTRRETRRVSGAVVLLVAAVAIAASLVVLRNLTFASDANTTAYSTAYVFAPPRYYTPGLPALALLIAAGYSVLISPLSSWRPLRLCGSNVLPGLLSGALVILLALIPILGVIRTLRDLPADPRSGAPPPYEVPNPAANGSPVVFSGGSVTAANGFLQVEARAAITMPPAPEAFQVVPVFTLVDAQGATVSRCEIIPGEGVYPTSRWRVGEATTITASIPICLDETGSEEQFDLRLQWMSIAADGSYDPANLSTPLPLASFSASQLTTRAPSCPASLGVIAGAYQAVAFQSPPEAVRGDAYVPSMRWLVLDAGGGAAARVFHFTHEANGAAYSCRETTTHPTTWRRGETIYFDTCPLTFPPDAPIGSYRAEVELLDAADAPLGRVTVGTIRVR